MQYFSYTSIIALPSVAEKKKHFNFILLKIKLALVPFSL